MAGGRHRWVEDEPDIPFACTVLYEDPSLIVIDKPHFVPTMPRGMWYRQTALMRLRMAYGEPDIVPAHRLDRMTAGVVVFVRDPALRGAYQKVFQERQAEKYYECVAPCTPVRTPRYGVVRRECAHTPFPLVRASHIRKERGQLQAFEIPGQVNAITRMERGQLVRLVACGSTRPSRLWCQYDLHPLTGKTHQLRVHMASLGLPIVGDDWYPQVMPRAYDDFAQPLRLVARSLAFDDPVSGRRRVWRSQVRLDTDMQALRRVDSALVVRAGE